MVQGKILFIKADVQSVISYELEAEVIYLANTVTKQYW